jgi:OmpA-OmpF porin, OOP family
MRKLSIFVFVLLTCITITSSAQITNDTLVQVTGKIFKAADSTALSVNLLYEKLPYYDDIGMALSKDDGSFDLQLIKGNTYNFSIKKDGWKPFSKEIKIKEKNSLNFYIEEDIVELRKLENLIFSRGSDQISESSFEELDGLAKWLNDNPTIVVQLEGHTDFAGNADANMRLSEARVISVQEYLTKQGVKKNRLLTKAFGGTQPETQERTDEAKTLNRRVEVRVIRR